ncbi:hypothetical protein PPL_02754 [Heterostelium album PN500]|uniref:Uncharacterized protein n=1 Tax=Heterostelium pallidum (strain ATCC 26659 / Pp 5 / PN500) TaxID=670386 RepID=D3B2Y9_HETP5|nr:hypothetical protein PPL_02754 [Heterostelium album PN500]EFA83687.1 hypothetical protein PPL_02754 [Heterostelium album PN500]|eukprot:XP_020435804.1 hypothetical protein PPL_02754 [Heterostelium album PN500]
MIYDDFLIHRLLPKSTLKSLSIHQLTKNTISNEEEQQQQVLDNNDNNNNNNNNYDNNNNQVIVINKSIRYLELESQNFDSIIIQNPVLYFSNIHSLRLVCNDKEIHCDFQYLANEDCTISEIVIDQYVVSHHQLSFFEKLALNKSIKKLVYLTSSYKKPIKWMEQAIQLLDSNQSILLIRMCDDKLSKHLDKSKIYNPCKSGRYLKDYTRSKSYL